MSAANQSARLTPLLKLEQNREQEHLKTLGNTRAAVAAEEEKLQQLVNYRAEYEKQVTREGEQGISAFRLQTYHQFLNRLSAAINQQQVQLEQVRKQSQHAQQAWFEQRGAVKRMDNLVSRRQQQEQQAEARHEQKTADEQAGQRHRAAATGFCN